jgi:hypothetical protein
MARDQVTQTSIIAGVCECSTWSTQRGLVERIAKPQHGLFGPMNPALISMRV